MDSQFNTALNDCDVNKLIQRKFCRVITDYGEGTGYIENDEERLIVSSFHLMGAIKKNIKITQFNKFDNRNILSILHTLNYIDNEFRLNGNLSNITAEEIINKIKALSEIKMIPKTVVINPENVKKILDNDMNKNIILQHIKQGLDNKSYIFPLHTTDWHIIASALYLSGYLNQNFNVIKACTIDDLMKIIPVTQSLNVSTITIKSTDGDIRDIIIHDNNITNKLVEILKKVEKEIVLPTETVEIECDDEILIGKINIPEDLNYSDRQKILKNFAYFDVVPIKIMRFKNSHTLQETSTVIYTGDKIDPLPQEEDDPMIGEKIYFGGYPLTQQVYTFSAGMISSITSSENKTCYVIEAPVAPGNSGSQVFIQRNGNIHSIGIISSEVAHVPEKMISYKKILQNIIGPGGISVGINGKQVDFVECFKELSTTLLDNLSTGKGKVYNTPCINNLLDPNFIDHNDLVIDNFFDFLVLTPIKKEFLINQIKQNKENQKNKNPIFFEEYAYKDEKYKLCADKHNKHISQTNRIIKAIANDPIFLKKKWGKTDATFNEEFANNYKNIIKQVIKTIIDNDHCSDFVEFENNVGWDRGMSNEGEETNIVELYCESYGSHMRPKAKSWWNKKELPKPIKINKIV
ncbi:MAG: hypothetical protein Terrestrivirus8_40 [Terrestrivirus sp.]|uniref:Serine protease n=1 Tax=Terrestrivirus sp. TaxID=2487775 RepID=A0A3G4ZNU6_9VIRU|nr:MAG: hypothetical protein Terrestrivirus8_40 [Terrestrivirus sp.]